MSTSAAVIDQNNHDASSGTSSYSSALDSIPSAAGASPPRRVEMVEAARRFLSSPRVAATPLEEQKRFLREKGVSDAELNEALTSLTAKRNGAFLATAESNGGDTAMMHSSYPSPHTATLFQRSPDSAPGHGGGGGPGGSRLLSIAQSAVVIGGATYLAYKLVRTWVLPRFGIAASDSNGGGGGRERIDTLQTQMNELQNSTKFIMDSVVQTLETVSAQQEQLNRALLLMSTTGSGGHDKRHEFERLHADIGIVKSLLLNQSQFPSPPSLVSATKNHSNVLHNGSNGSAAAIRRKPIAGGGGSSTIDTTNIRRNAPSSLPTTTMWRRPSPPTLFPTTNGANGGGGDDGDGLSRSGLTYAYQQQQPPQNRINEGVRASSSLMTTATTNEAETANGGYDDGHHSATHNAANGANNASNNCASEDESFDDAADRDSRSYPV